MISQLFVKNSFLGKIKLSITLIFILTLLFSTSIHLFLEKKRSQKHKNNLIEAKIIQIINQNEESILSNNYSNICKKIKYLSGVSSIEIFNNKKLVLCNYPLGVNRLKSNFDFKINTIQGTKVFKLKIEYDFDNLVTRFYFIILVNLALFSFFFIIFSHVVNKNVIDIFKHLNYLIKSITVQNEVEKIREFPIEFKSTINTINITRKNLNHYQSLKQEYQLNQEKIKIANQVAHDIRSPIASLKMALQMIEGSSLKNKKIIQNAINHINDVANNLLSPESDNSKISKCDLIDLTTSIIEEKKIQYSKLDNVSIKFKNNSFKNELYSELNLSDYKRVLSNIINNSVEAISHRNGKVVVTIFEGEQDISIKIKDNGHGISANIIDNVFQNGTSYKKENGNGLGLFHAKESIEKWGGKLKIHSVENEGTEVSVLLTKSVLKENKFFSISEKTKIVIIDDDKHIHEIWRNKLQEEEIHNDVCYFFNPQEFMSKIKKEQNYLAFLDYHYKNHHYTGIDYFSSFPGNVDAKLVTSQADNKRVIQQSVDKNIELISKDLIASIKFNVTSKNQIVLIDDDKYIRFNWIENAKNLGLSLHTYSGQDEFLKNKNGYSKNNTEIYIDEELNDSKKGSEFATELFQEGFKKISITTGHNKSKFKHLSFLHSVISKTPPFQLS